MHDTTTFAFTGEVQAYNSNIIPPNRQSPKGLWPAVEEFLASNPQWMIQERFHNNNGLTILKKI
jgi:hypothetical protein